MSTIYDVVTLAAFAALIVLFLHRSDEPGPPRDALWQYLVAAAGCGLVNWLGNAGHVLLAIAAGGGVLAFVAIAIRPFERRRR